MIETTDTPEPLAESGVTLPDGRALAYAVYGDPDGTPLFYFHGHPGSRLEAALLHEAALAAGVRVIGTDRPGMGRSDFHRGRTIPHWSRDVAALADRLAIDRFAVLGISGGGPYAAVCAHALRERVSACLLIASASPAGLAEAGTALAANRLQARLARYLPLALDIAFASLGRSIRKRARRDGPESVATAALAALPPVDRAALATPARAARYGRSLSEAFRQGGRGAAWEARLLSRPWGFDLADIGGIDTHVWQGELDRNVPVAVGRRIAAIIPGARGHFRPDHGHLSIAFAHLPEILAAGRASIAVPTDHRPARTATA